jgi:predicted lipoprotein with Yx(FWY)xxD motif
MLHGNRAILAIAILPVLALGLAACGGSNSSDPTTAASASNSGDTIGTSMISGTGNVLVDSKGAALYTNDMDSANKIACTGQCLTEWVPLPAPAAGNPTSSDSAVQSMIGTTNRSDGSAQVTFGGKPLYTFVEDTPGQVTGNGFSDSFGGTHFVWTAATVGGGSTQTTGGGNAGY